jgi:hypothetical protein
LVSSYDAFDQGLLLDSLFRRQSATTGEQLERLTAHVVGAALNFDCLQIATMLDLDKFKIMEMRQNR